MKFVMFEKFQQWKHKYVTNLKKYLSVFQHFCNKPPPEFQLESMWVLTVWNRWTQFSSLVNTNSSWSGVISGSWASVRLLLIQIVKMFLFKHREEKETKKHINTDKKQVRSPWGIQLDRDHLETWGVHMPLNDPKDQCEEEKKERGVPLSARAVETDHKKRKILEMSYQHVSDRLFIH